jgi:hypothetical protein
MHKVLDQSRELIRVRPHSYRAEQSYTSWILEYILFPQMRRPLKWGAGIEPLSFSPGSQLKGSCLHPKPGLERAALSLLRSAASVLRVVE